MNKAITAALTAICCLAATAGNFKLTCNIEGLLPGDTVVCDHYQLIKFHTLHTDTVPVTEASKAVIATDVDNPCEMIVRIYRNGEMLHNCHSGEQLFAMPGETLTLSSSTGLLGSAEISGGIYDNPAVQEYLKEENAYAKSKISIYKQIERYRDADADSVKKYSDLYNANRPGERLMNLRKKLCMETNDNIFGALLYISHIHQVTASELEQRIAEYSPEIQSSYPGSVMKDHLAVLRNTETGATPRNFTLIDKDGNSHSLTDYRGHCLMLLNWGMCPGTFWANPRIVPLYEKYHGKGFDILGLTDTDWKKTKYYGSDEYLTEQIDSLAAHKWPTVYKENPANAYIDDELYLPGVPFAILISPEGKVIARGFYNEIEDTLKATLEQLP